MIIALQCRRPDDRPPARSTASSSRSLTTTCPNSSLAASSSRATRRRAVDLVGVVGAAADQPRAQRVLRRRRDEDLDRLGHRLAHLARALDLDLEHDGRAPVDALLELVAQRAVAAAGVLGVLDEVARRRRAARTPRRRGTSSRRPASPPAAAGGSSPTRDSVELGHALAQQRG